jgi:GT2 family glycosyltransferase
MFPSLTALSERIGTALPGIARYLGPINPVKLASPWLVFFVWRSRHVIPLRIWKFIGVVYAVGTVSTLIGAATCHFPPDILREWAVMTLGPLCALCLLVLPPKKALHVVIAWAAIVYGCVALNAVAPELLSRINATFFDPVRQVPVNSGSAAFLIGFYDVASLSKLVVWLPWLLLWSWERGHAGSQQRGAEGEGRRIAIFVGLAIACSWLSMATTERGSFLGMLLGIVAFVAHVCWVRKRAALFGQAMLGLVVSLALVPFVLPTKVYEQRVRPLFARFDTQLEKFDSPDAPGASAWRSIDQRRRIYQLAVESVRLHPFGSPCYTQQAGADTGILQLGHAHNLFLEQARTRGWAWGLIHAALWFGALFAAFRRRDLAASALVGGLGLTISMGMIDYPWLVINHAMILGILLIAPWVPKWKELKEPKGAMPELKALKLSVIIPSLGRERELLDTVRALMAQTRLPDEIVVVDQNVPPFPSVDRLLASLPLVRHVKTPVPGFCLNCNLGLTTASGDIALYLDDDIVPEPTLVERHLANYADPAIVGVAGRGEQPRGDRDPATIRAVGRFHPWSGKVTGNFNARARADVTSVWGGNMSYRRQALLDVGGFDLGFVGSAYFNEADLSQRVLRHGGRLVFDPLASVRHLQAPAGGCRVPDKAMQTYYFIRNGLRLARRHSPRAALPLIVARMFFHVAAKAAYNRNPAIFARGVLAIRDGLAQSLAHVGAVGGSDSGGTVSARA